MGDCMSDDKIMELINMAKETANKNFCCKYSGYTVGAVLLDSNGKIYKGFNIENNGIQVICAERSAFTIALNDEGSKFVCIAIVSKKLEDNKFIKTTPCGYCRQFMSEYCDKDFLIYTYDDNTKKIYKYTLEELLPESFDFNN